MTKPIRPGPPPEPPADILTGAEQLALPDGCQCSYALSHRDSRWHLITRDHCPMHGRQFAPGERVRWTAPGRIVTIAAARLEHHVTLNLPDGWRYDIADPDTGKILLYAAKARELARLI
jgi:hypothetical protein